MGLLRKLQDNIQSGKFLFTRTFLTLALFMTWLAFFDNFSLVTQYKLSRNISQLETEKQSYIDKLAEAKRHRDEIFNDKEKYAREQYLFHEDNEEVILIPTKNK